MKERASNVPHVEYEVFQYILNEISLSALKKDMVTDKVTEKRFTSGVTNVAGLIQNMMDRRKHKLPKDHVDYEVKK